MQEALTNVRRHAGPAATATVRRRRTLPDRAAPCAIDDTGAGADASAPDAGGNGIPGMRERAAALGGTLDRAARGPDGGFRVDAALPLRRRSTDAAERTS